MVLWNVMMRKVIKRWLKLPLIRGSLGIHSNPPKSRDPYQQENLLLDCLLPIRIDQEMFILTKWNDMTTTQRMNKGYELPFNTPASQATCLRTQWTEEEEDKAPGQVAAVGGWWNEEEEVKVSYIPLLFIDSSVASVVDLRLVDYYNFTANRPPPAAIKPNRTHLNNLPF